MNLVDGFKIRLVMVVFGLTLIYFVVPAQAQVLLSDNFNDGNYDGWTVIDGSWSAADGVLRGKKTGWSHPPTIETSLSLDSTTVTLEFDTYLRTSWCRGPTVCLKDANDDVILRITMEHCPFNPTYFIEGTVLGASIKYSWSADNEWHNIRFVADGGKFDVYLDGTKIIQDIVYGDTTTYLPATKLWIGGWEHETTGCAYDNIIVTSTAPSPAGVTIRGTVLDALSFQPDGSLQPLAGAKVTAKNGEPTPPFTTEADGKYKIGGLPDAAITVTASKSGYRSESQFLPYPPAAQCPYKTLCDGPDSLCNVNLHLVPIDAIDCNTTFRPIRNGFHYKNIGNPGFCLGMSFAAFNLWMDDTPPSPRTGETDIDWLLNSDDAQAKMIRDLQFKYAGDLYYGQWPFKISSLDKLCTDLDLGKPRVLNLGNLTLEMLSCRHAVLAYKAVKTPTRSFIWVYDPTYPETESVITFTKIFINKWKMDTYKDTGWNGFNVVPDSGYFRPDSPYKFEIVAHSPVSLKVTDPDGSILSQNLNEIDWGRYQRLDYNGDGNDDEVVTILWPKEGTHSIDVIANHDALPTETYSLEVTFDGETVTIAENVPISDIPDEPYKIQCTPTGINVAPIANAGDDQTVYATVAGISQVALDGSGSCDPDGDDLTYSWYLDGQKIATGVSPTIQLPAGVYVIDLVVSDGTADSQPDQVRVIVIQTVGVDIKPGSWPNTINLGSNGVIPVAILTTESFDATSVDPSTVQLEGLGVAVRGKSEKLLANEEDVDEDGDIDLVVKIETENLEPGAWQSGLVVLTGETYDGQAIEGCDEIIIVPPE